MKTKKQILILTVLAVLIISLVLCCVFVRGAENHQCRNCDGSGVVDGDTCEECNGEGVVENVSMYEETFMALMAPIIAITLALITKEVYSSLFIGILVGGLLYGNFSITKSLDVIINDGIISAVADSSGIFVFLVILGILVALVNKAGGSNAFGKWAQTHVKTKTGALLATFALGVLIFIDDYFNCLTVGSVMKPVTDGHKISRAKLAYLIDATAAPICMIAPISSWAAAVAQYAEDGQGLNLFITAIPYNFYSILTLVFIIIISILGFDYGKMAGFEITAQNGDVHNGNPVNSSESKTETPSSRGKVIDLILPIAILIVTCVVGLIYVGGFFDTNSANYLNFAGAFGDTDAYVGLPWGGLISLVIIIVYLLARKVITFKDSMDAIPKGFIAMVPAILILTFATALKNMTSLLGAKYFVAGLMSNATNLAYFLPAIIFVVACFLAFSTGTSWGTFGILIPIVTAIFTGPEQSELLIIGMSACLAGAVCGDHCSPISDTTIMASAGAQCNHVDHVTTQLPYAITVACVSFVSYIIAAFIQNAFIVLPISIALMVGTVFAIHYFIKKKEK